MSILSNNYFFLKNTSLDYDCLLIPQEFHYCSHSATRGQYKKLTNRATVCVDRASYVLARNIREVYQNALTEISVRVR